MRLQGTAQRLTILVDEADQWHHRPLYVEIVHRAHRHGLAGATVLRGTEGFATGSTVHTSHLFTLGEHLPIVIIIVDDHHRIGDFLAALDHLIDKGVVLLDDVDAIRYIATPPQTAKG
jgi:hypothetical protein